MVQAEHDEEGGGGGSGNPDEGKRAGGFFAKHGFAAEVVQRRGRRFGQGVVEKGEGFAQGFHVAAQGGVGF